MCLKINTCLYSDLWIARLKNIPSKELSLLVLESTVLKLDEILKIGNTVPVAHSPTANTRVVTWLEANSVC